MPSSQIQSFLRSMKAGVENLVGHLLRRNTFNSGSSSHSLAGVPRASSPASRFQAHFELPPCPPYRHSSLPVYIHTRPPPPPYDWSPRGPQNTEIHASPASHLRLLPGSVTDSTNITVPIRQSCPGVSYAVRRGDLEAARDSPRPASKSLSPIHVMVHTFVFLMSTGILFATAALFYLLPEQQGANPAGFFAVLYSAASIASALVAVHRLQNPVVPDKLNGRKTWPSAIAIGLPLVFLICALVAFTGFFVGFTLTSP